MDCDCDVFTLKFCQRHKAERESAVHARISALREELGRALKVVEAARAGYKAGIIVLGHWVEGSTHNQEIVTPSPMLAVIGPVYIHDERCFKCRWEDALAKMGEGKPQ